MRQLLKTGTSILFRRQTNILSAAIIIMATYGLSHLIGLFKTRLLIGTFFATSPHLLDAYNAAFLIPDTIFQLLVIGSLSAAFIPVFTRYLVKEEKEAWHVASSSLNLILLVFFVLSIFTFIFVHPLAHLIAPGFDAAQITVMSLLIRIMLVAQLFFCVSGFLTGIIQSHQRFLIPALAPVVYNLGIIFGIICLSPTLGIVGPAIGVVIGALLHMLIQIPLAIRLGFRFLPVFDFRHTGVKEIIRLMPPRTLALGVDQIEQFVSVILTSLLAAGSLSLLNVARLLYAIPASIFGVAIGQAALPTLSQQSGSADRQQFRQTLTTSLLQITFLALPVSILFVILRIPIVRLAFGSHSFPWLATLLTAKTLAVLAVSAVFSAMMQLIIRGFYALHDTRTPLIVGLFAAIFDTVAGILFIAVFKWGIVGIALAISLTSIIETITLFFLLARKVYFDRVADLTFLLSLSKMAAVAIITSISLWIPMRLLDQFVFDTTRTLPLIGLTIITSLIGLTVYMSLSTLFRVQETATFYAVFRRITRFHKLFSPKTPEAVIVSAPDQN